jgi:hypothetical protein
LGFVVVEQFLEIGVCLFSLGKSEVVSLLEVLFLSFEVGEERVDPEEEDP